MVKKAVNSVKKAAIRVKNTKDILTESYNKPTPKRMRKIGDAILGLGSAFAGINAVIGNKWLTIAGIGFTWAGKTITNFWSE